MFSLSSESSTTPALIIGGAVAVRYVPARHANHVGNGCGEHNHPGPRRGQLARKRLSGSSWIVARNEARIPPTGLELVAALLVTSHRELRLKPLFERVIG